MSHWSTYTEQDRPYGRVLSIITSLFILTCLVSLAAFQLLHFSLAQATSPEPEAFADTVLPILKESQRQKPLDTHTRLSLSIGLQPRTNKLVSDYMQSLIHVSRQFSSNGQQAPSSPMATPAHSAHVATLFSPDTAAYNKIQGFLQQAGFTITRTYQHHLLLDFSGTAGQTERFFHVRLHTYLMPDHQSTYYANDRAPQLPREIAPSILSINGLNNLQSWQHARSTLTPPVKEGQPLPQRTCPGAQAEVLDPARFARVYNLHDLYKAGYQGEGQTVALFELAALPNAALTPYLSCVAPHTTITTVTTGTHPLNVTADSIQALQDTQLVLNAAPHLEQIRVYQTTNDEVSYLSQWARILEEKPELVSTGWYQCEGALLPQLLRQEYAFFQFAALQGQTILASAGNTPCATPGTPLLRGQSGASDPAAQPFVTGIGGTSLTTDQSIYAHETPNMILPQNKEVQSSQYWQRPVWQQMTGLPERSTANTESCAHQAASSTLACRVTPDVSLHTGNPQGYWFYCGLPAYCDATQPWSILQSNGASAPLWAGFVALTNQMLQGENLPMVGFLNALLYAVANDPVMYARGFHDVTTASADKRLPQMVGYDSATGLGSYNAYNLATYLLKLKARR